MAKTTPPPRRKVRIPDATRRQLAVKFGCPQRGSIVVQCAWCGAPGEIHWATRAWVTFPGLEIDHIVPEARGGTGDVENLTLACRKCNRSRGSRTVEEWGGAR